MESQTKNCQNCKNDFVIESDDFAFYEKMKVPAPTFCPECRLQRRLAWRNENGFHNRECGFCGKKIISIYSKDFNNVVYCGDCWYGDDWEAADHWQDIDFSKAFLTQFYELCKKVPAMDLFVTAPTLINSQYCNMADNLKNCYFLYDGNFDENISYASGVYHSKDSLDLTMARKCELCYESITCVNCYKITHCQQCEDCMNVYFSFGLKGCNNCIGCVNLRQKSYCVFNKQYTKEEYEKYLSSLELGSYKASINFKDTAINFWKKFPKKFMFGLQNLNVSGDYLEHSKNAKTCFGCANLEDSKFCSFIANGPLKTTYDFTHYGDNVELSYECLQSGDGISNCKLNWGVWTNSDNVEYSFSIHGCSNIFGCVGLKKKKYCILNKQYTKEEYEALVSKIIQHMNDMPYVDKRGIEYRYGEFFPIELSPFGYNETTAQEYYYSNKNQVEQSGYTWREADERNYQITKKPDEIPDNIADVADSILKDVIACDHGGNCGDGCTTAFRILSAELDFYRKMDLPLPRLCSNCRRYQRIKKRNTLKLWHRQCMKEGCLNEFETSYAPDRPEIVYCESCYQQEVA